MTSRLVTLRAIYLLSAGIALLVNIAIFSVIQELLKRPNVLHIAPPSKTKITLLTVPAQVKNIEPTPVPKKVMPKKKPPILKQPALPILSPKRDSIPIVKKEKKLDVSQSKKSVVQNTVEKEHTPDLPKQTVASSVQNINRVPETIVPIYKTTPIYPIKAIRQGIEGSVMVTFTVDVNGKVKNVMVLQAEPVDFFEKSVLRAIKEWRFEPKIKDGKPIEYQGKQIVKFKLQSN